MLPVNAKHVLRVPIFPFNHVLPRVFYSRSHWKEYLWILNIFLFSLSRFLYFSCTRNWKHCDLANTMNKLAMERYLHALLLGLSYTLKTLPHTDHSCKVNHFLFTKFKDHSDVWSTVNVLFDYTQLSHPQHTIILRYWLMLIFNSTESVYKCVKQSSSHSSSISIVLWDNVTCLSQTHTHRGRLVYSICPVSCSINHSQEKMYHPTWPVDYSCEKKLLSFMWLCVSYHCKSIFND